MSDDITPDSTYPKIELPIISSDIPPHLLATVTPESKYILEQISALGQYVKWSAPVLISINDQTRKTNGRVISLEQTREELQEVKRAVKSWWAVCGVVLALIGGIAGVVETTEFIIAHFVK
jgi:hypothetical protein